MIRIKPGEDGGRAEACLHQEPHIGLGKLQDARQFQHDSFALSSRMGMLPSPLSRRCKTRA